MHITEKQLRLIAEIAAEKAIEAHKEQVRKHQKERADRRLRNTKLLLRKYRSFKLHCKDIKLELEYYESRDEILAMIEDDEQIVESIKRSKRRTLAMVNFIDQMLEVYRIMCERSRKPEEERRCDIIHKMYIADEKMTAEAIAECHLIDTRTVYRDINKACETLSALMFGIDSVKMID